MSIIGFIGSRLFDVVEALLLNSNSDIFYSFSEEFFTYGGFMWYGGLLMVLFTLLLFSFFYKKLVFLKLLDTLSITACLAYGIGRFGCLFSGDGCFGKFSSLPWGMYFPYGVSPNIIPVHPTPLYESILSLLLFFWLLNLDNRKKFVMQTTIYYFLLSSIIRFCIEFLRINPIIAFGLTSAQLISISLIVITTFVLFTIPVKHLKLSTIPMKKV